MEAHSSNSEYLLPQKPLPQNIPSVVFHIFADVFYCLFMENSMMKNDVLNRILPVKYMESLKIALKNKRL